MNHSQCSTHGIGSEQSFGVERSSTYISEEQANHLCTDIPEMYLLRSLAGLCDNRDRNAYKTNSIFEWFLSESGKNILLPALRFLKSEGYDFGTTYFIASTVFAKVSLPSKHKLDDRLPDLLPAVRAAVAQKQLDRDNMYEIQIYDFGQELEVIKSPYTIPPRRIWDIKSNRVFEFCYLTIAKIEYRPGSNAWEVEFSLDNVPQFWAISHSWTDDMQGILTNVNGNQWPVPLPAGVSLEQVRRELIGFGARYVWLDVLCLRQESGNDDEQIKKQEEWKIDVPTIGNIYGTASSHIVRYFNGLGRKFCSKDWDGSRHWLQRAWTLQEVRSEDITYNGSMGMHKNPLNTRGTFQGHEMTLRQAIAPICKLARQIENEGHGRNLSAHEGNATSTCLTPTRQGGRAILFVKDSRASNILRGYLSRIRMATVFQCPSSADKGGAFV